MPTVICMADHIFDETEPDAVRRNRGDVWEASQEFVDFVLARDEAAKTPPMLQVLNMPEPKYGGRNPGPGRGRKRKVTYPEPVAIPPRMDADTDPEPEVEDVEDR